MWQAPAPLMAANAKKGHNKPKSFLGDLCAQWTGRAKAMATAATRAMPMAMQMQTNVK